MNLKEVIIENPQSADNLVLYARLIDGKLLPNSDVVLLELTDEELEMKTDEIANRKCPGFSYCIEVSLLKEMINEYDELSDEKISRLIYYIENDA